MFFLTADEIMSKLISSARKFDSGVPVRPLPGAGFTLVGKGPEFKIRLNYSDG